MATTDLVLTALADLRADLESGQWVPTEHERALALGVQAEGGVSADAVRAGLRAAGRDGTVGRLPMVAARCGYVLDGMSLSSTEDRQSVATALDEVLGMVVLAGLR